MFCLNICNIVVYPDAMQIYSEGFLSVLDSYYKNWFLSYFFFFSIYWARFISVLHKQSAFPLMSEYSIGLAPAREHKGIMVIGRLIRNHIVKLINSLSSESGPWGSIMTPKSLNHIGKGEEVPWLSGSAWRHFAFVRHNASGEIGGITVSTGTRCTLEKV